MPMLYAGFVPSTLTSTMRPSGSWPIAPRAWRPLSWRDVNASPAWKIGLPFFTSSGPPPIALARPLQSGESESSASTCCPTGASALSWAVDCVPRATSTAPPRRNRCRPGGRHLRHGPVERLVRAAGGKRPDHRLDDAGLARGRGAVRRRVERELARLGRRVQRHRAALTAPLPDPGEGDATGRERAVSGDAEARTPACRRAVEHAVLHVDPARRAGGVVEVVAVDRHSRRVAGHPLLEARERLLAAQLVVGEGGGERVDLAVGLRRRHDVEDDRAARREVHFARVGHARQQE